jgi:hypothetical protein
MTEMILGPKSSTMRHRRSLLLTSLIAAAFAVFFVAGANGILSGSTFDSANGKLDATSAAHDWNNPVETITCGNVIPSAGTNCGLDLVGSQSDDALGQGSKEDQTSVQVVDGSIPPSKDDLSRFYLNHEKVGAVDYLYLAWERSNLLGSAHLDFELNKNPVGLTSTTPTGTIVLNRTAGDKLIDFDFGGSGVPVLAVHTWTVSGTNATADCEIANTYPCWSKGTVLGSSAAEAAVNNAPVIDQNNPSAPRTLAGNSKNGINSTFGEMGINLQAAGIFSTSGCNSFADAWVKSRSSGNSFGSELKDIIAPIPTDLHSCGTIIIKKVTVPSPDPTDTSFAFTAGGAAGTIGPTSFSLKNAGSQEYDNVPASGSSNVSETVPAAWLLTSATCDNGDPVTAITVAVQGTTTCTFTNTLQLGALKITKESSKSGHATLAGAEFSITGPGGYSKTGQVSDANGVVCVDGILAGSYTVTETKAPTGYTIDNTNGVAKTVTATGAKCSDASFTGETLTFFDTPKTDLDITVASQDTGPGGSNSTITCTNDAGGAAIGNSPQGPLNKAEVTATGLAPGNYTCKVNIDP